MADLITETSTQGCLSRISETIIGIFVGIFLVLIATSLLFWNEGRAVKRAEDLNTGRGAVVSVGADKVISSNDGALVHVSGNAVGKEPLSDAKFGITTPALVLHRVVEMYQWEETKKEHREKKTGGSKKTTTTYSYAKDWNRRLQKSSAFKEPNGHENPGEIPFDAKTYTADVSVGVFRLAESGVKKIGGAKTLELDRSLQDELKDAFPNVRVSNDRIYLNGSASDPKVGDVRIVYEVVKPQVVTVVAAQQQTSLVPYRSENLNGTLELVESGEMSAEGMFENAADDNKVMTWILRIMGFFFNYFGLALIFKPISVVADIIPLVGDIVEMGTRLLAGLTSAALSFFVISIGWLFYRPLIGIQLVLLAVGIFGVLVMKVFQARSRRKAGRPLA